MMPVILAQMGPNSGRSGGGGNTPTRPAGQRNAVNVNAGPRTRAAQIRSEVERIQNVRRASRAR